MMRDGGEEKGNVGGGFWRCVKDTPYRREKDVFERGGPWIQKSFGLGLGGKTETATPAAETPGDRSALKARTGKTDKSGLTALTTSTSQDPRCI